MLFNMCERCLDLVTHEFVKLLIFLWLVQVMKVVVKIITSGFWSITDIFVDNDFWVYLGLFWFLTFNHFPEQSYITFGCVINVIVCFQYAFVICTLLDILKSRLALL